MPRSGDAVFSRETKKKKQKSWWLDATIRGERHVVHLGTGINKTVALELAKIKRADILRGKEGIGRRKKDIEFTAASKLFLESAESNLRPSTVKFYRDCFNRLGEHFTGMKLSKITKMTVETYKRKRKVQTYKKRGKTQTVTIRLNRELVALRTLFYKCAELGKFEGPNPLKKVVLPFKERDERGEEFRTLDQDERGRLTGACNEPLRTIVVTGLHAGLRTVNETLPLKWKHIDFEKRRIIVESYTSKSKRRRAVPMTSVLYGAMCAHRDRSGTTNLEDHVFLSKHGKPFKSVRTAFETARKRAGLGPDVGQHCLRHTWASELGKRGVDIEALRKLGGWRSYRMVQRYYHTDEDHLAESIEKLVDEKTEKIPRAIPQLVAEKAR